MARKDPRDNRGPYDPSLGKATDNAAVVSENLDQPIILWVEGIKQSDYIIQAEYTKENEIEDVSDVLKVEEDT